MTRDEFIKQMALMGMGITLMPSLLTSCKKDQLLEVNFNGRVTIIGAGAAGLMAAYMLKRYHIDFELIEASNDFGGRVKKIEGFADFPIDLGAEWIHDQPSIFGEMINNDNAEGSVDLVKYDPQTISTWSNNQLTQSNWANHFYGEYKFKRTTWYDFFEDFIVPTFSSQIIYNSPVTKIDYSGSKAVVTTAQGNTYESDKVLITVPISVLQAATIEFTPALPSNKVSAINNIDFPPGIKVFMEFSERFYPDLTMVGPLLGDGSQEQIYYDAAFKKDSNRHILSLFYVGDGAAEFTSLPSNQAIIDAVLNQLDTIFNGQASQYYVKHVIQNWSNEPYIRGSYSHNVSSSDQQTILAPIDGKVYFAGEALHEEASSTVHGAGLNANAVVENILKGA